MLVDRRQRVVAFGPFRLHPLQHKPLVLIHVIQAGVVPGVGVTLQRRIILQTELIQFRLRRTRLRTSSDVLQVLVVSDHLHHRAIANTLHQRLLIHATLAGVPTHVIQIDARQHNQSVVAKAAAHSHIVRVNQHVTRAHEVVPRPWCVRAVTRVRLAERHMLVLIQQRHNQRAEHPVMRLFIPAERTQRTQVHQLSQRTRVATRG